MLLLSTKRQQKLFYKVRFIKTPIFINRNKQESDFCIVFTADSNLAFASVTAAMSAPKTFQIILISVSKKVVL